MHQCGDEQYDPRTAICCGGQVERPQSTSSSIRACCGGTETGTFYFIGQQVCCGGSLKAITADLKCCSDHRFYNESTHTCCGAEIIAKSEGKVCCPGPNNRWQGFSGDREGNPECCGTSGPYWPETQLCCQAGTSAIRERLGGEHDECCGLNRMDASTHMCCGREQRLREPFMECCGRDTYNVTTEICCGGVIVPRGPNGGYECCGRLSYNPQNEVCCFGRVHPIGNGKCCTGARQSVNPYQPGEQSCCNSRISSLPEIPGIKDCCNDEAYLTSSKMCCNGNLFDREKNMECCGSGKPLPRYTYNTNTHLCCNGSILPKLLPNDQCCGSQRFDPTYQTCCLNQVKTGVGKCCRLSMEEALVYDEQTQTCCGSMDWNTDDYSGNIYDVPPSPTSCCGAHLLAVNQLCDNDKPIEKDDSTHNEICWYYNNNGILTKVTFNKEQKYCDIFNGLTAIPPGHKLCGSGTYNPETHLCCDDHVHSIDPRANARTDCCGFYAYDKTWQSCLLGKVFDGIPQEYAGYCRDKVFDNRTDKCDINFEIRPISEVMVYPERCGTEPYDPAYKECCNGVLIASGFTCCEGLRAWETPGTLLGEGQCCSNPRDGSSKGYNSQTHICCLGEVYDSRGRDIECCGSNAYEPSDSSSMCCGQRIHDVADGKTECTGTTPHRTDQVVCDGVVHQAASNKVCCGKSLIDPENRVCCNDVPYAKESQNTQCCGKVSYDSSTQICCESSVYQRRSSDHECCGHLYYDTQEQECYQTGGHSYVFSTDALEDEAMLCLTGSYDSTRHTCCGGILHKHIVNGECCGHRVVRNPDEEICCGGKLKRKERGYTECCGGNLYNPKVNQCCGGKILSRYSNFRQCCNDRIIRTGEECVNN
nr:uncharacterized protein LOC129264197 [Lytechinus pictus]